VDTVPIRIANLVPLKSCYVSVDCRVPLSKVVPAGVLCIGPRWICESDRVVR